MKSSTLFSCMMSVGLIAYCIKSGTQAPSGTKTHWTRTEAAVVQYIKENAREIFDRECRKIGVQDLKIPDIELFDDSLQSVAVYDHKQNVVKLNPARHRLPERKKERRSYDVQEIYFDTPKDISNTLRHEFMHSIMDQIREKTRGESWPPKAIDHGSALSFLLISEGVAEYADQNGRSTINCPFNWPTSEEKIAQLAFDTTSLFRNDRTDKFLYFGGFCLAKPIVEKHGLRGIEYLMDHPPRPADLMDVPGYQRKVLKRLADSQ